MPPKQEIVSLKIRLRDIESVVKEAQSLMSKTVSVKRSKTFDIPKYFCLFCASFVCPVGRWVSRIWELINARMPVCRATAAAVTSRVLFTRTRFLCTIFDITSLIFVVYQQCFCPTGIFPSFIQVLWSASPIGAANVPSASSASPCWCRSRKCLKPKKERCPQQKCICACIKEVGGEAG